MQSLAVAVSYSYGVRTHSASLLSLHESCNVGLAYIGLSFRIEGRY